MSEVHDDMAKQQAVTVFFTVASKLALNGLGTSDMSAKVLLRAALQLLRDGFDPVGLDEEEVEFHLLDTVRLLLRKEGVSSGREPAASETLAAETAKVWKRIERKIRAGQHLKLIEKDGIPHQQVRLEPDPANDRH